MLNNCGAEGNAEVLSTLYSCIVHAQKKKSTSKKYYRAHQNESKSHYLSLQSLYYNYVEITLFTKKDRVNKQKHFWKKMKCDVRMMIDHDVAEEKV